MKMGKFFSDIKYLLLEQLLELRPYWFFYLAYTLALPLMITFGLTNIAGQTGNVDLTFRVVVGSAVFMLANECFCGVAIRVTTMYHDGTIAYYASLPISKMALILALLLSRLVMVALGIVAPLVLAPILFNFHVVYHPLLILVVPLTTFLLATIGMIVGLLTKMVEVTQTATYITMFLLVLATPVFISSETLPVPLRVASQILPFTYIAEVFNRLLGGMVDTQFWIDVVILSVMAVGSFLILDRRLKWQSD